MSAIRKFYSGRSVFITGGIGFIGKQIVEKLLRSCPEVENIYLLLRPKKDLSIRQRLDETLTLPVFDRLTQNDPNFRKKIIPISGDVTQDLLGLSESDRQLLASKVSVVFHSAAMLNMMESLSTTVDTNVVGVRRMLTVCKELPKLEALVHISTAYSQVDRKDIEEKIYEAPVSPKRLIEMTRVLTEDELSVVASHLLKAHSRPNNYAISKAVGERLVSEERGKLPVCIVRPSIVGAALAEPMEGWIETYNGMTGMYAGIGTGLIRIVYGSGKICVDVIPIDLTANAIVTAAWHTALNKPKEGEEVPVYNYASSPLNHSNLDAFHGYSLTNSNKYRFKQIPGRRSYRYTQNQLVYQYYMRFLVPLRCLVMDTALRLMGKPPSMKTVFDQSKKLQNVLIYFTTHEWNWSCQNLIKMQDKMNEIDKKEFTFDVKKIDWPSYYKTYWFGIRKYLLKDPALTKNK